MGKLGDLFVRLGLKNDDYKKGIKEAKKETQGFGRTLQSMKAGALAVWAAIGSAVTMVARDIIESSNKMSDSFNEKLSAMKAAYHSFIVERTSYRPDFSSIKNFFKNEWEWTKKTFLNANEAGKAAAEMAKAFDAEFELTHSIRIQRGAIQQELNELYTQMRDTTLDPGARRAAAEKYKVLLQPLADAEIKVYQNMLTEAVSAWQAGTGLQRTESEIIEFFSKIGTHAEQMQEKFADIFAVFNDKKGDKQNIVIFDVVAKYQEAVNMMSNVDKELARVSNSIKATIQRDLDAIAQAVKAYGQEKLDLDLEIDIDVEELDFSALDAEITAFADSWNEQCLRIADMNTMLEQSLISSFSNGMQALTDFMMGVESASAEQVLAAFIQPLADTMKQMGEMFMAEGIAMVAFKESIKNPTALIAAGAALIAVSSIVSSGLKRLTSNPAGGTSASSAGTSTSEVQTFEQDITVHVVGTISGSDIVLAGDKTLNKWRR